MGGGEVQVGGYIKVCIDMLEYSVYHVTYVGTPEAGCNRY